MRFSVQCNNAPLCPNTAHLFFHHISVILIPPKVSLSKTVTQSLPHSLSLSICQSAVSHSLIQSVPHFLSLSVSRSFSHCIPLSLFAHLTSPSLTHLYFPPIHHSFLVARFLTVSSLHWSGFLSFYHANILFSESLLCFVTFIEACPSLL